MSILSHSLFFMPCKKLLIRPMLMRGRAQAFSFDESARSSRLSGISVSSRKNWYSHSCHQDVCRSSSGVLYEVLTRRRVLIHMRKFFLSPACPLIRCVHVTGREAGASSGPLSSLCLYNLFKIKKFSWKTVFPDDRSLAAPVPFLHEPGFYAIAQNDDAEGRLPGVCHLL